MVNLKKLPTHPLKKTKQNAVVQVPLSNIGEGALYSGKEETHRGDAESGRQKMKPRRKMNPGETRGWGILGGRDRGDNELFS